MSKYPNLTSATIVKDSISSRGHRMTTVKMVFPRYILAEVNTHRVFGRNSASSRAIPFRKMVRSALDYPYVPMAFQKDHTGMQGNEYLDPNELVTPVEFSAILKQVFKYTDEQVEDESYDEDIAELIISMLEGCPIAKQNLEGWWLYCRDKVVECAILMASLGVTKQLCNRILEPFIYHTALITSTEWENFFELRSPQYDLSEDGTHSYKSKKDYEFDYSDAGLDTLGWLQYNKGQGEIHIMDLAEKTWDAMNESIPKVLADGEWHIPFGDNIDRGKLHEIYLKEYATIHNPDNPVPDYIYTEALDIIRIKIATARAARISYELLGDNPKIDYEADIKLHDSLLAMKHMSPFEHIGRAMTDDDFKSHIRTSNADLHMGLTMDSAYLVSAEINKNDFGWSRNLHGFVQYREIVEQIK